MRWHSSGGQPAAVQLTTSINNFDLSRTLFVLDLVYYSATQTTPTAVIRSLAALQGNAGPSGHGQAEAAQVGRTAFIE